MILDMMINKFVLLMMNGYNYITEEIKNYIILFLQIVQVHSKSLAPTKNLKNLTLSSI